MMHVMIGMQPCTGKYNCTNFLIINHQCDCHLFAGVKVRLPVLTAKDVEDVQKFACKNHMDFVAASFVQSADDVRCVHRTVGRYTATEYTYHQQPNRYEICISTNMTAPSTTNTGMPQSLQLISSFLVIGSRYIRKVLNEAGGRLVRIISKIESSHGLQNYDDILAESDGIMVARGDLAMEIPSEKVKN